MIDHSADVTTVSIKLRLGAYCLAVVVPAGLRVHVELSVLLESSVQICTELRSLRALLGDDHSHAGAPRSAQEEALRIACGCLSGCPGCCTPLVQVLLAQLSLV